MDLPQIDIDSIREVMKLMDQFRFDEIEVRDEGKRIHLLRGTGGKTPPPPQAVVVPAMVAAPASVESLDASAESADLGDDIKVITSPMVGTFYRSSSPDAQSFVEEHQQVTEETVLCIIEAMKVMNEIRAECDGELVQILVANGEAVEYGEPLFHVRVEK